MASRSRTQQLLGPRRPPRALGALVAVAGVAAATAVVYPLKDVAPVVSLGVVYLLAVVVVALFWGLALGLATSVLSIVAFGFFHLPPAGRFTLADEGDWVSLAVFAAVATITGLVAELARAREHEADQRRREADLAAELAQLLLGATRLEDALPLAARRLAHAVGVQQAAIELGAGPPLPAGCFGLPLHDGSQAVATLVLPEELGDADRAWVRARVVPALESILVAALHRAELQAEVVETDALRRSDEMKTAVLRSVSHDLRTPVTAILSAAGTLDPEVPSAGNVAEVRELVTDAAQRLWRLIEKLLDLSLLQAGQSSPRVGWCSIEEVLREAVEHTGEPDTFVLSVDPDLPLLEGDPAQLERAFANVLENALRYRGGHPVTVRARAVGERVRVLVVDQGPGIPPAEQERVFMPFYRAEQAAGRRGDVRGDGRGDAQQPGPRPASHHGSGLGLAIARGFVEVNGGRIGVESVPGQGTSFVIEFPLERPAGGAGPAPALAGAPAGGRPH